MSRFAKFGLLTSLYLSQGLPYGFFTEALPAILTDLGLSMPQVGLANLLLLPWALKFLWAPLVDRYGSARFGRRRSWIVPLQLLSVAALLTLSGLRLETQLGLILAGFLIINLLAATQDIATDGLAVETLSPADRGLGNGIQVAAYRVGMIVGSGFLLMLFPTLRWSNTLLVLAVLLAAASIPILLDRPSRYAGPGAAGEAHVVPPKAFLDLFRQREVWPWLLLILLYKGPDAITSGMLTPFLRGELALSFEQLGQLKGFLGVIAGLLGAILGGLAVPWLGRRKALLAFGILQALAVGAYTLPALGLYTWPSLAATVALEHFTGGLATAVLFTMMMDVCRPGTEGSDYTVQASIAVIAALLARSASGFLVAATGFAGTFAISGALTLLAPLAAAWLLSRESFRSLPVGEVRW